MKPNEMDGASDNKQCVLSHAHTILPSYTLPARFFGVIYTDLDLSQRKICIDHIDLSSMLRKCYLSVAIPFLQVIR